LALSVAWSILRFHDFTLERRGEDLRIRCGLLTKIAATVPRRRIQFISVRETMLHRPFKRVSIRIETAGGKAGDNRADAVGEKWIVPLAPRDALPRLLEELRPGFSFEGIEWHALDRRARRRMVFKANVWAVIIGACGLFLWRPWGALAIVPLAAWFTWLAVREWKSMGFALGHLGVLFRSGVWTKRTSLAPYDKVQVAALSQSPFDRRHGHASIHADTAGAGPANHRIAVPYVGLEQAREAVASLYARAEAETFRWA
jgi:putative membrane protein